MSALNSATLSEKLDKLNASQQSIETLSQWCIFFRQDAQQIVTLWEREFQRANDVQKMLALVYLANDILQNSRKKGPQFVTEFYTRMPAAMHKLLRAGGPEVQGKMSRMIKVWDERKVFGTSGVKVFTDLIGTPPTPAAPSPPVNRAGRKRGNVVLQGIDPNVNSLSSSMQEADEAHSRSQLLLSQTTAVLRTDELPGSGAEQLKASIKSVQIQKVAFENEIGHRDRVMRILEDLLSEQRQLKDEAERQLEKYQSILEERQRRAANAAGASQGSAQQFAPPPPPAGGPHLQSVTSPVYKNDPRQRMAQQRESASIQASQPSQATQSPPQPSFHPPSPPESPRDAEAELSQMAVDMSLLNGSAADGETSAADIVAQLSQNGMSTQMLLDALAAMPNGGTQAEHENGHPVDNEEEEYDPEFGA